MFDTPEVELTPEVARLDRDWSIERTRYLLPRRYGGPYIPTPVLSLLSGAAIAAFGVYWMTMAWPVRGRLPWFPWLGLITVFSGVGAGIYWFTLALAYRKAHQLYQQRRAQLMGASEDLLEG